MIARPGETRSKDARCTSGIGIGGIGYSRSRMMALRLRHKERRLKAAKSRSVRRSVLKAAILLAVALFLAAAANSTHRIGGAAEASSRDGSFTAPTLVNDDTAGAQGAPCVMMGIDGEAFVAWQDSRSGDEDIYLSSSEDEGISFRTNVRVDDSPDSSRQIEPSGAMASNGTIHLVWQDNRSSDIDNDIFQASSSDGGYVFRTNTKVDDSSIPISWQERPSVAVAEDGVILVAWTDDRTGVLRVRMTASTDGGTHFVPSFEIPTSQTPTSGQTGVALVANEGKFYIAYLDSVSGVSHPYLTVCDSSVTSFGDPVRLDSSGNSGKSQRAISIAPHPARGVLAVWEDSRSGDWDIYGTLVSSSGYPDGPNFRVDDSPSGWDQRDPVAATDIAGNIYVAWEDDRNDSNAIRFTYAVVGQSSFHQSYVISSPSSDEMQRKPAMCVLRPGTLVVAWQDDSRGTYDIVASQGYIPELDLGIPEFSDLVIPVIFMAIAIATVSTRNRRRAQC